MTIDQLSNLIKDPNIFGYLIVRPFGLILLSLYNFVHNYGSFRRSTRTTAPSSTRKSRRSMNAAASAR